MPQHSEIEAIRSRVLVRVATLIRLRWLAILGQTIAIVIIAFVFAFPMPWQICLLLIAVSAIVNIVLAQRYRTNHRLPPLNVLSILIFDVVQLGILLGLTGGLQNPFAILLMAPVIVSATSLSLAHTLILGGIAAIITSLLVFYRLPLPWFPEETYELPLIFVGGVWVAINCTLAFTAIYAFRVAEEARKLADALTATELVLQREQHLTAIDGLAAAAAHELGTPLATIALVSKEMMNAFPEDGQMREDAALLRNQAQRCSEILQKLTSLSSEGESVIEHQSLTALVEEVIAPLRDFGVQIDVKTSGDDATTPTTMRHPGVHYGLGNIVDNAVDFAKEKVVVQTHWTDTEVLIEIFDDGPGFPADVIPSLGDPFVTSRSKTANNFSNREHGLGLGLFIARTLLERSGAEVTFGSAEERGAKVTARWPRSVFEAKRGSD